MGKTEQKNTLLEINVGRVSQRAKAIHQLNYGSIKGAEIRVFSNGISVLIHRGDKLTTPPISKPYAEIVKLALRVFLVEMGRCDAIYDVAMSRNGEPMNTEAEPFRFLAAIKDLTFDAETKKLLVHQFLTRRRSEELWTFPLFDNFAMGHADNALEYDRFRYLFSAFNSFYSLNYCLKHNAKGRTEQDKKQQLLDDYYGGRPSVGKPIKKDLHFRRINLLDEDSTLKIAQEANVGLANARPYEAFVLSEYAYYLRCRFFHGEASIPLVSYKDDGELTNIHRCNEIIESFLSREIGPILKEYVDAGCPKYENQEKDKNKKKE